MKASFIFLGYVWEMQVDFLQKKRKSRCVRAGVLLKSTPLLIIVILDTICRHLIKKNFLLCSSVNYIYKKNCW